MKLEINKGLEKLLDRASRKGLIPKIREDFKKRGPLKIKQSIMQDIIIGVSPVKGAGKWVKYSELYKDAIKGQPHTDKDGRKFVFRGKRKMYVSDNFKNTDVTSKANPKKAISPVNLRLSGALHKSLNVRPEGSTLSDFRIVIAFTHFLADIHNRRGAGKSKVIRRLLPNRRGEDFNRNIKTDIIKILKLSTEKVVKQFTGQ